MKFRIGYRTIKTAVGTSIAIMIAQMFGLENYVSAGIITILCIQVTKKKSLMASWARFFACLMSMVFASLFFELIAFHPLVIGLLLLFFIPVTVMMKVNDGIVTSSVIILHIYNAGEVTRELLINELGLITIGIGVALLANLYMPSLDGKLIEYQQQIEENFKIIFDEIVKYLRTNESNWDGSELTETYALIEEARALANRDTENRFIQQENLYYSYFRMREKQFEIIERVLPSITSISLQLEQGEMIADFIEELSEHIHPGNTAIVYIEKLLRMRLQFQNMELPKTREEFEARAALLHFTQEMEQYMIIKSNFKGLKMKKGLNQKQVNEAN
ncbi:aromatic acid exporter family protein [Cytobacillus gottheilii]|uniref:aromatic acid exporter family protein n=1 Tax=Cytobacillus gottheilii TaxID=859144 RepID=UPI002494366C|nr:aromatic acid exporter family protein [Cytobacillus gottheilii]